MTSYNDMTSYGNEDYNCHQYNSLIYVCVGMYKFEWITGCSYI